MMLQRPVKRLFSLRNRSYCVKQSYHKTGAELIYDKLVENNVKHVFGYSGGSIMPLIDKFNYQ